MLLYKNKGFYFFIFDDFTISARLTLGEVYIKIKTGGSLDKYRQMFNRPMWFIDYKGIRFANYDINYIDNKQIVIPENYNLFIDGVFNLNDLLPLKHLL